MLCTLIFSPFDRIYFHLSYYLICIFDFPCLSVLQYQASDTWLQCFHCGASTSTYGACIFSCDVPQSSHQVWYQDFPKTELPESHSAKWRMMQGTKSQLSPSKADTLPLSHICSLIYSSLFIQCLLIEHGKGKLDLRKPDRAQESHLIRRPNWYISNQ